MATPSQLWPLVPTDTRGETGSSNSCEAGATREEIERHVVEVLVPQGHTMLVTSRPDGLKQDFLEHFEWLTLRPLTEPQQQLLLEQRLGDKARAEELLEYVRAKLPPDTETGLPVTGNPLMLSMIVSTFKSMGGDGGMPQTISALYAAASAAMLERVNGEGAAAAQQATVAQQATMGAVRDLNALSSLLDAIFFRAHAAQRRLIEEQHVDAAALELGAPATLAAIEWPAYKGRVRTGQVVRLLRGEHAGANGVLSADARGDLINGRRPRKPYKVSFASGASSGWVKESDLVSSGLDQVSFAARFGGEGRRKAMHAAVAALPAWLREAVQAVRTHVSHDQLPLLSLLQSQPLLMQSAHLSFQEYYAARAIFKGMALPGEPPWRWSAWWANTLQLGSELGDGFGLGLVRAAGLSGSLDLSGQIGGHRPTSVAAVAQLIHGLEVIDLSENNLSPAEVVMIARAVQSSPTLTALSLSKNSIGDAGAVALATALVRGSKLTTLNLFGTSLSEQGCRALVAAVAVSKTLLRLNLQFNALKGDSKRLLEAAAKMRNLPLSLAL